MKNGAARIGLIVGALALAGAGVGGWLWWRADQRAQLLAASIAPPPDLGRWPAELSQRVADCDRRAQQGGGGAVAALGELSRLYQANGFLAEAMQGYAGLLELEADNPRWPHLLAIILAGYGRIEESMPLERRAIALAPDYLPARIRLGDSLVKVNRLDEAEEVYEAVLTREPRNPHALIGLARCDIEREQWQRGRERLEKVVAAQPDFLGAWNLLGTVCERLGDREATRDAREKGRLNGGFRELHDAWADELMMRDCYDAYRLTCAAAEISTGGDPADARPLLERAVAVSPDDGTALRELGKIYIGLGEFTKARQMLERATQVAPGNSDTWVFYYRLLNTVGDRAGAGRALEAGLAACPTSGGLRYELGRRLAAAGQLEEALAAFRESGRLQPHEPGVFIEAAQVCFKLDRVDDGLALLREALTAEPDNPVALATLAVHAIYAGDEAGALDWIRRVRQQTRTRREDLEALTRNFQEHFGHLPPR